MLAAAGESTLDGGRDLALFALIGFPTGVGAALFFSLPLRGKVCAASRKLLTGGRTMLVTATIILFAFVPLLARALFDGSASRQVGMIISLSFLNMSVHTCFFGIAMPICILLAGELRALRRGC